MALWWVAALHVDPDAMRLLADDPNPRLRLLALTDKASTPGLVDQFADDPDRQVRDAAAVDPRMSPALLVRLLLDERTARSAAQNPGIPAPVMHHMIEVAKCASIPGM